MRIKIKGGIMDKYIYLSIGVISLILATVGVILPVIPTTPFLLVTSFCFARGSEKFNSWFTGTKIYKKNLESFAKNKAMTLKQKIKLLAFTEIMMLIALIVLNNSHVKILLACLMIFKMYYFIFKIKTIK